MKTVTLIGFVSVILLASCSPSQQNVNNAPVGQKVPVVNYPTTQAETPATKYCVSHGGTVSVEDVGTGGVEAAYCTLSNGTKVDAWKYMSEDTQKELT